MGKYQLHQCAWCHGSKQEQEMLQYHGVWFCGINHLNFWERQKSNIVKFAPPTRKEKP